MPELVSRNRARDLVTESEPLGTAPLKDLSTTVRISGSACDKPGAITRQRMGIAEAPCLARCDVGSKL